MDCLPLIVTGNHSGNIKTSTKETPWDSSDEISAFICHFLWSFWSMVHGKHMTNQLRIQDGVASLAFQHDLGIAINTSSIHVMSCHVLMRYKLSIGPKWSKRSKLQFMVPGATILNPDHRLPHRRMFWQKIRPAAQHVALHLLSHGATWPLHWLSTTFNHQQRI